MFLSAVLVAGALPEKAFTYSQTNCEDPAGTKMLFYATIVFLVLGLLIVGAFVTK